jgi:hypothetical protein
LADLSIEIGCPLGVVPSIAKEHEKHFLRILDGHTFSPFWNVVKQVKQLGGFLDYERFEPRSATRD